MENLDFIWQQCCRSVIAAASRSQGANLQFAASFAKAGLPMKSEARRVQALYILCNLSGWRGDQAKDVKAALKKFSQA